MLQLVDANPNYLTGLKALCKDVSFTELIMIKPTKGTLTLYSRFNCSFTNVAFHCLQLP